MVSCYVTADVYRHAVQVSLLCHASCQNTSQSGFLQANSRQGAHGGDGFPMLLKRGSVTIDLPSLQTLSNISGSIDRRGRRAQLQWLAVVFTRSQADDAAVNLNRWCRCLCRRGRGVLRMAGCRRRCASACACRHRWTRRRPARWPTCTGACSCVSGGWVTQGLERATAVCHQRMQLCSWIPSAHGRLCSVLLALWNDAVIHRVCYRCQPAKTVRILHAS